MSSTIKIGVHHSGPTSPTNPLSSSAGLTENIIQNAHRDRDFGLSALGWNIGYNVVVYRDGTWKQYRLLGEETCAAIGSNFDTFHICLIGNFTVKPDGRLVDEVTSAQRQTLRNLIIALIEGQPTSMGIKVALGQKYGFSAYNIFPHRVLHPHHTSCYGDGLSDNYARDMAFDYLIKKNATNAFMVKILSTLRDFFNNQKFGRIGLGSSSDNSDEGIIYNLESNAK